MRRYEKEKVEAAKMMEGADILLQVGMKDGRIMVHIPYPEDDEAIGRMVMSTVNTTVPQSVLTEAVALRER